MFDVPLNFDEPFGANPERSRLISLKPIDRDTAWQESIGSLLVRIAKSHTCSPLALLNHEILPTTNIHHRRKEGGIVTVQIKTMNGVGKYASELVRRLEILTMQEGLQRCSYLPWADIIDPHGVGLLHPNPHWCKSCFTEWRSEGKQPYFPLMWMSAPVKYCIKHGDVLSDLCPHCGKYQPFVPKHAYMDHCSHCGKWLGSHTDKPDTKDVRIDDIQYVTYQTNAICEIFEHSPANGLAALLPDFRARIREVIDDHFDGNIKKYERAIGVRSKLISDWLNKEVRPTISLMLLMTYRLGTTPVKFLKNGLSSDFEPSTRIFTPPEIYEKHRITPEQREGLGNKLRAIIANGEAHKPMKDFAQDLGYPFSILKYYFSEECSQISNLFSQYRGQKRQKKKEDEVALTKEIVQSHLDQRLYLSNRMLEKILAPYGIVLKRPDVRQAIKEVRYSNALIRKSRSKE